MFMKDKQFRGHITKTPPKLPRIYGFKKYFCRKDYRNYSKIEPEVLYRTWKESTECGLLDIEELIW
jgi:hypothetical protein